MNIKHCESVPGIGVTVKRQFTVNLTCNTKLTSFKIFLNSVEGSTCMYVTIQFLQKA